MSKEIFNISHPEGLTTDVTFQVARYDNGNLYLGLFNLDGEPYTDVTTNMGAVLPRHAYIKNYDENEGMVKFLLDNELAILRGKADNNYVLMFFEPEVLERLARA